MDFDEHISLLLNHLRNTLQAKDEGFPCFPGEKVYFYFTNTAPHLMPQQ